MERGRRSILERIGHLIELPIEGKNGTISDMLDLEIGPLDRYVRWECGSVDHPTRRLISELKDVRDALAHLEPVSERLLSHQALERMSLL